MKQLIIVISILLIAAAAHSYDVNQGEDTWLYYSDGTGAVDTATFAPTTFVSIGNPAGAEEVGSDNTQQSSTGPDKSGNDVEFIHFVIGMVCGSIMTALGTIVALKFTH